MSKYNRKGFTLVEIMIVVAIIGLLAAIAIPNFVKARETAQRNACINNLRLIDAAKEQYALEWDLTTGSTAVDSSNLADYFKGNTFPGCPASGDYTVEAIGTSPTCTITDPAHAL